jgi:hypothetical protein
MPAQTTTFEGYTLNPFKEGGGWRVDIVPDPLGVLPSRQTNIHPTEEAALSQARIIIRLIIRNSTV